MAAVKRELERVVGRIMLAAERELSVSPLLTGADLADVLESIDDAIWNAILSVGNSNEGLASHTVNW